MDFNLIVVRFFVEDKIELIELMKGLIVEDSMRRPNGM
jgi:hypothetical protein